MVHTQALNGGLNGDTEISDLLGSGLVAADGSLRASVADAASTGDGEEVFTGTDDGMLNFRSLIAGRNVSIPTRSDELVLNVDDDTINNDARNIGNGTGLYAGRAGRTLRPRSLIGGDNVSLSASTTGVTIDATTVDTHTDVSDDGSTVVSDVADINFDANLAVTDDGDGSVTDGATGGENNTASNAGTGAGPFKAKSGVDLAFRSLTTSDALTATANTDTVALAAIQGLAERLSEEDDRIDELEDRLERIESALDLDGEV